MVAASLQSFYHSTAAFCRPAMLGVISLSNAQKEQSSSMMAVEVKGHWLT